MHVMCTQYIKTKLKLKSICKFGCTLDDGINSDNDPASLCVHDNSTNNKQRFRIE